MSIRGVLEAYSFPRISPNTYHYETPWLRCAALSVAVAGTLTATLPAQEREDRSLLTQEQLTAIINEVSGDVMAVLRAREASGQIRLVPVK